MFKRIKKQQAYMLFSVILSGLLLAACYPGAGNLSGLIWVWMFPLFPVLWKLKKKRHGFALAYLAGLAFWLINLKWLWAVSGIGATVLPLFLSLYFGLWGLISSSIGNPWRGKKIKSPSSNKAESRIQKAINKRLKERNPSEFLGSALGDSFFSLKIAFINAAAWVGLEWLRGWLFTGFGWNGLGVAFHDTPVLMQAADLVGVVGLAFTPVFMSAVIIQTAARLKKEAQTGKLKPRLDFSVAAVLLAIQFCYGVWRLHEINKWETDPVRVLLVQENTQQIMKWDPAYSINIQQGYVDSTTQAIEDLEKESMDLIQKQPDQEIQFKTPDLVIWPESAVLDPLLFSNRHHEGYIIYDDVHHMLNEEILPLGNFNLISGMNEMEADFDKGRATPLPEGRLYNSLAIIPPNKPLETGISTYHKVHLVIFGEYIPWVNHFPFLKSIFEFSAGGSFTGNFSVGQSTEPLNISANGKNVQVIPSICFEDTVGRLARKFVRPDLQMIVNVTNDGWFKETEAAAQHIANAKFRSVELRRPIVRSANTGVSGIISASGSFYDPHTKEKQVIEDEHGSHFTKGTLFGYVRIPTNGAITLYALAGDWFAWLMIACVGFSVIRKAVGERV